MGLEDVFNPHFAFSAAFDGVDFTGIHFFACLSGALLAIYVMGLFSNGQLSVDGDCYISRLLRRTALFLFAVASCWSLAYSTTKGWTPWPPDLLAIIGMDVFLASSILVAYRRRKLKHALGC